MARLVPKACLGRQKTDMHALKNSFRRKWNADILSLQLLKVSPQFDPGSGCGAASFLSFFQPVARGHADRCFNPPVDEWKTRRTRSRSGAWRLPVD
jgi:hypothetical protein